RSAAVSDEQDLPADFEIATEDSSENSVFMKAKKKAAHQANLRMQLFDEPERFK
ncbi:hypothetical protein WUBG_12808, partial [Wuchereria bancrofti]